MGGRIQKVPIRSHKGVYIPFGGFTILTYANHRKGGDNDENKQRGIFLVFCLDFLLLLYVHSSNTSPDTF